MNVDLLIVAIVAASSLGLVFLKTNVAFTTLALMSGVVLADAASADITSQIGRDAGANIRSGVHLLLLLFPAFMIAYRFRRSQRGGSRIVAQIIPAIGLSLVAGMLIFDSIPLSATSTLLDESVIYQQLDSLRPWLIIFAIFSALLDVLLQHSGPPRAYQKRKKGH